MSTSLITGYANGPHVTSKQQGACNAASFTAGKYVLNIGECFAYELVSNNLIRVKEGMAINQGRYMCIDRNDYEELTIDNGLQGVKRSDLIVIRYEKNQNTGIETSKMMVIKGTSGDSYVDPEHQEGNILEGDLIDDLLLYRVNLNGLNVESVEVLFNMKNNMDSIEKKIGSTDISGIGDGTFTGGLAALNNSLGNIKMVDRVSGEGNITESFKKINLCSKTLQPGLYLMIASVQSTNVSGTSALATINNGIIAFTSEEFSSNGGFFMQTNIPFVLDLKNEQTIYLDVQTEASSGYWFGSFTGLRLV